MLFLSFAFAADMTFQCPAISSPEDVLPFAESGELGSLDFGVMILEQALVEAGELSWEPCENGMACELGSAVSSEGLEAIAEHSWEADERWTVTITAPEGTRNWTKLSVQLSSALESNRESTIWIVSWEETTEGGIPEYGQLAGLVSETTTLGSPLLTRTEAWNDGECFWASTSRIRVMGEVEQPVSWTITVNDSIARISRRGAVTQGKIGDEPWMRLDTATWEEQTLTEP